MPGVTTAYQTGVHGSRPANGAGCILYSCTTHGLVYRDDGTSWTTFLTSPAAASRASLGLDTTDSPEFAGLNIGAASDTTLARSGAGELTVEGNRIFRVGGADVPIADGGTGASTKAGAFDALSPMSASGDIVYGGASGTGTRLAKGSDGQVLTLASGLPSWAAGGAGGAMTLLASETLGSAVSAFTAITGISSAYKDLILTIDARATITSAGTGSYTRFGNGSLDTGNNYINDATYAGWATGTNTDVDRVSSGTIARSDSTAGMRGFFEVVIHDYASTSFFKAWNGAGNCYDASGVLRWYMNGVWKSTSALERLQVAASSGNFAIGSKLYLWGRA